MSFYIADASDFESFSSWIVSSNPLPLPISLALSVAIIVGLPFFILIFVRFNRISAAERFLETQHFPAGQDEVDALIGLAAKSGQGDAAMQMFADIRRQHGHDGLRKGHVMWVLKQLAGEIPTGAVAPAFRGTQPTEPT